MRPNGYISPFRRTNRLLSGNIQFLCCCCLLFIAFGCRNSRLERSTLSNVTDEQTTSTTTRADSTRIETSETDSVSTTTETDEFIRTTSYRDDGTIQAVQEHWRRSGSVQLAKSSGRSSTVRVTDTNVKVERRTLQKVDLNQLKKAKTDSRLIQGADWWCLLLGLLSVALIVIGIRKMKK